MCFKSLLEMPVPRVGDGEDDVVSFPDPIESGNGLVQVLIRGFDGDRAAARHGFRGIGNQVEEGLAQMNGRARNVEKVCLKIDGDLYPGMVRR